MRILTLKKTRAARIAGTILACIMLLSTLAGCAGTTPTASGAATQSAAPATSAPAATSAAAADATPPPQGGTGDAADAYVLPLTSEPATLKFMVDENSSQYKSKTEHLPVTAEIERLTGVTLEIEAVPLDDFETIFSTRMAAGTDLPDITYTRGSQSKIYEYGLDGMLVGMKQFVDKYDTYLEAMMEAEPEIIPAIRFPDGDYYLFSSVLSGTDESDPYGWMIRRDWLEAVNMDAPTTITEWEAVMQAFTEQDANGNGDMNDEIAWCARGLNEHLVWGQMWGLPYRNMPWREINGTVEYSWITDDAKAMFTWLAECYANGYFSPEFLTLDHNSLITRNVAGAFCRFANNLATRTQYAREGGAPDAYYMGLPAPKGPDGRGGMGSYGPTEAGGVAITKACKDPDLAFRFLDWVWGSETGTTLLWFGIEGEHWTPNAEGKPNYMGEFFTNNPDGWTSHETAMVSIGGHTFFPSVRGKTGYWSYFADAKVEAATEQIAEGIANMAPSIYPKFPSLISTPEESDKTIQIETEVNTYFNEQATAFITGTRPISDWDAFVSELKGIGVDEWTAVRQQQFDRAMK